MRRLRRGAAKRRGAGIGLVAVGLLLGCSDVETSAPTAEPGAASATAEMVVVEPSAPRSEAPSRELPAPGSVVVSLSGRAVTVRANQVSRRAVLAELERNAGFRLKFAPGIRLEEPVTLDRVDAPLEEVLGSLLEGGAYALYFGVAPSGGRVLEQVAVGDFSATDVAADDLVARMPNRAGGTRGRASRIIARDATAEAERLERLARRRDENYARLDNDDPAIRAEAAEGLPADDSTIPALTDLAANDPDARVRKAAVSALGDAPEEDTAARDALIRALRDPDAQVVIAALNSIEWIGDASMIPYITPLLEHPNAAVRAAAEITIEILGV